MASFLTKWYPRATENRLWRSDAAFRKTRNAFLRASGKNFLYLQVLFLALFCWLMASLYQQETHAHNLVLAFVDYDVPDSPIAAAVRTAYARLQGDRFPTLREVSAAEYPDPSDLQAAVCDIRYWGALYVWPGASAGLDAALAGNSTLPYDPETVLSYIWDEARYSTVSDAAVAGSLQTLSQDARTVYTHNIIASSSPSSSFTPAAVSVLSDPWTLTSLNIQPTTQGSRAIYNTLVIILLLIQEFFYLGVINALYLNFKIYNRAKPLRIAALRTANSLAYTLVGSLCASGAIWAFKAGWRVDAAQWALTWLSLWLFAHLNFQALDVASTWLPVAYLPMVLIAWVVLNVTSVLLPLELQPRVYRVGYALPAHEVYQVLTDVWSGGCNPRLGRALPVLVAWEVVGFVVGVVGVYRRCHYATVAAEEQEGALRERVRAAVELARAEEEERKGGETGTGTEGEAIEKVDTRRTEDLETGSGGSGAEEGELERVLSRADERLRRRESRASRVAYGPAFGCLMRGEESDEEQIER